MKFRRVIAEAAMESDSLPACPFPLPEDLNQQLAALASLWAKHVARPRLDAGVVRHWDELIHQWSIDSSLPLLLRKQERGIARGEVILHESGRELVLTDNSPASWSYMSAYAKTKPTIEEVRASLERNEIPVAMIIDREMIARSRYKCSRVKAANPNFYRWKVCHRSRVALEGKGTVKKRSLKLLQEHFKRFLSPSNMFLVPLALAGLGELPHFIEAMGTDL
jgi:hypothetical protein